jgi:hypothetical protein
MNGFNLCLIITFLLNLLKLTKTDSLLSRTNNLDEIENLLKIEILEKCTYQANPFIADLCPRYKELLTNNYDSSKFLTLNDIENLLINKKIIQELFDKCGHTNRGWCLNSTFEISNDLFPNYGKSFCLVSTCYDELKEYVYKCADSEITKNLFDILPLLCKIYLDNTIKDYCVDETFKLFHVLYAFFTKQVNNTILELNVIILFILSKNLESFKIFKTCKDRCNDSCKQVSKSFLQLESCCKNLDLIKE